MAMMFRAVDEVCVQEHAAFNQWRYNPIPRGDRGRVANFPKFNPEMGLDPAKWASDPRNLARFGFHGAGDIDTLYQMGSGKS